MNIFDIAYKYLTLKNYTCIHFHSQIIENNIDKHMELNHSIDNIHQEIYNNHPLPPYARQYNYKPDNDTYTSNILLNNITSIN